jgi:hypothetical protein
MNQELQEIYSQIVERKKEMEKFLAKYPVDYKLTLEDYQKQETKNDENRNSKELILNPNLKEFFTLTSVINTEICRRRAHTIRKKLMFLHKYEIEVKTLNCNVFCFRIIVSGKSYKSISISVPPDRSGNQGDSIPDTIELALFGHDNKMMSIESAQYENEPLSLYTDDDNDIIEEVLRIILYEK